MTNQWRRLAAFCWVVLMMARVRRSAMQSGRFRSAGVPKFPSDGDGTP
jgi:hypothetical protein